MGDVVPRHHQVAAVLVAAADDDMGVRMAGVEMVHGHPVELGVEVALHLGQEVANEGFEVGEAGALVGRHDEAELVRVLVGPVQEGAAVHVISGGIVEPPGGAFAGDAIANDVLQVRSRRTEVAGDDADVARLDDHPPGAGRDEAAGSTQAYSHAPLWGDRRDVAALPQCPGALLAGLPEHERSMTLRTGWPSVTDTPELGIELVLSHHTPLDFACWRDEIWRTRWNSRRW
jgi:hypothetical protein